LSKDVELYADLLGKKFRLGSRGPNEFDCWGLCYEVGRRAGITFPTDFTPCETKDQNDALESHRYEFIKLEKPEPLCIVTFRITPPYIDHCGIVLPNCKQFLHIMVNHDVAVQRLDHRILVKRIEGFYKLKQ